MSSVFPPLAAGKGKVMGRVKNEEETPDVPPVHPQRKECKLKILDHRHKKNIIPAGDQTSAPV